MNNTQDLILTIGSLIFVVALIPLVLSKDKPVLASSIPASAVLFTFAGVYASLHLWFTAITTLMTGTLWAILAFQKYLQQKKNS